MKRLAAFPPRARRLALVLLAGASIACGATGPKPAAGPTGAPRLSASAFAAAEDEILHHLAALDRRFASRAHITASEDDLRRVAMAAVFHEDATVAVIDGRIDPFSFDARARGLAAAQAKVAVLPLDAQRPSERDLLSDLVDAELIRLDEERALPRSASSLVRAIVDSWQPPATDREVGATDRWLAGRLAGLREAIVAPKEPTDALDVIRARELDDALDALERIAGTPGFIASTQELVRVRDAVEAASSHPAAKAHADWSRTARRMRAHLGLEQRADELARQLAALEESLRSRAGSASASAGDKQMFVGGPCADSVPGSRVRSMAASPEREPACHLRHLVAEAPDGSPVAIAAMHDHVVVAQWATDVARGHATIASTQGRHRFLGTVPPEARTRYERIALARPVAALGAALTVKILMAGNPHQRALLWSSLGDVPLDVAERELTAH